MGETYQTVWGAPTASHIAIDVGTTPSSGLLLQMILYDEASDIRVQSERKKRAKVFWKTSKCHKSLVKNVLI